MLALDDADVARLLSMDDVVSATAEAAVAYTQGRSSRVARTALSLDRGHGEFLVMPGTLEGSVFGVKIWHHLDEPAGEVRGTDAVIYLVDNETGQQTVLAASAITDLRTGAMTALAATRLAPAGAEVLGIIGAGVQARSQILALVHSVPSIATVRVFARHAGRLAEFVASVSAELRAAGSDATVVAAPSGCAACEGASIVVAATTSSRTVVEDAWIADAALVCGVGAHAPGTWELDAATVGRASVVAVDTVAGAIDGAGDIARVIEAGHLDRAAVIELGDLLQAPAVESTGVAVFKSVGFAIADVAVARLAARRAREG